MPAGAGNDVPAKRGNTISKPSGLHLDTAKVNLVTKGQFRLYDNTPFEISGDTLSKSIPVMDRFGNSYPQYYLRKTVLNSDSGTNSIVLFRDRAIFNGFAEYVVEIPPVTDTLKTILILEKPRFTIRRVPFRARWISAEELFSMVKKNGIDTRHYYRESREKQWKKTAMVN